MLLVLFLLYHSQFPKCVGRLCCGCCSNGAYMKEDRLQRLIFPLHFHFPTRIVQYLYFFQKLLSMTNATFEETCHMRVGWKRPLALTTNPTNAAMRRYDHSFSLEYPNYRVSLTFLQHPFHCIGGDVLPSLPYSCSSPAQQRNTLLNSPIICSFTFIFFLCLCVTIQKGTGSIVS